MDEKQDTEATYDGDFIVDEKARTATLTQDGVKKAEAYFHVDNLMDTENTTLLHHINQAIKAIGVMRRDIDYVVKDGQVHDRRRIHRPYYAGPSLQRGSAPGD